MHSERNWAQLLTMYERSHKPCDEISYAFVGDGRFSMGRSLLITGAIMGSDVRLVTLAELRPPQDVVELAASIVFDQAENRLHTIKAVLVATLA